MVSGFHDQGSRVTNYPTAYFTNQGTLFVDPKACCIWYLDSMFKAVEFPASIADLATGLTDVDGDALSLKNNQIQN